MADDLDIDMRLVRDRPTLRELTAERLREAIVSSKLVPGQRLVERDLCKQTGVSRSSLREALRQLEAEGLIERQGLRGLFVASISPEEARQIYEVRAAIEPEMARHFAARATEEDFARLSSALDALDRAIAARSVADYVKALDAFFDTLIEGSGNSVALRIVAGLRARISYLRTITTARATTSREKETLKLMRKIADDARRGDGDAVAARCRAFIERSAAFAIKILTEHHHSRAAPERGA